MSSLSTIISLALALVGASQSTPARRAAVNDRDVQIRINGPAHVTTADTASAVWVVNNDATIDGVVREALGVVNGTARISGRVEGSVVVVNGNLELAPGARIDRDVMLYRSTMTRANGAVIAGVIHDQTGFSIGAAAMWLIWLSFTIVVVLAGLVFAELAPAVLAESATQLTEHGGRSALAAVVVAAVVPALAVASFATVIGIPLGLVLLVVAIPALTLLGYLVTGVTLGGVLGRRPLASGERTDRYLRVVFGLVMLQVVTGLPVVGALLGLVASLAGVGALVGRIWSRRQPPLRAAVPAPVSA